MSGFQGLNPTVLRDLGAAAQTLAGDADGWNTKVSRVIWDHDLSDFSGQLLTWCAEVNEEMTMLSELAFAKADGMELAAMGATSGEIDPSLLTDLQASLHDDIGPSAMVGDAAVKELTASFDEIDTSGDGELSLEELEQFAKSTDDESARAAAQYLVDNPVLYFRLVDATDAHSSGYDGERKTTGITRAGIQSFLEQNELIVSLSDRKVFDEIAGARGDGASFNAEDLDYILDHPDEFSPEAIAIAQRFQQPDGTQLYYLWSRSDEFGRDTAPPVGFLHPGDVSYDDVIALTVNHQVFAADPVGARDFVNSLTPYSTWTDLTGNSSGIKTTLSSDDGLRALARSALIASPTLMDQVTVVANLPESTGGERNKLINHYYAKLGYEMNLRLNPTQLDPWDVDADGFSGFNWMMHGVPASYTVGAVIRGDTPVTTQEARQAAADGNQYIFGQMAFQYVSYLDAFPIGSTPTSDEIDAFFNQDHPASGMRGAPRKLFDNGQRQLRDGFGFYLAATHETDMDRRQQLTLGGTALLGIHEQAGIQNYLQTIGDHIPGGMEESFITDHFITETIPGTGLTIDLSEDIPQNHNPHSNRTLSTPFYELDLQPGHLKVGNVDLDFGNGTGDVSLQPTWGWDNPPKDFGRGPFPADPNEWIRHSGDPSGDRIPGSRAEDWFNPVDRMFTIGTVFQQYHTDPRFMTSLETILDLDSPETDLSYLDGVIE